MNSEYGIVDTPDWCLYYGNNQNEFPKKYKKTGSIKFGYHLNKKLSPELWDDLVYRLCIKHLCIYRPDEARWALEIGPGHCVIELDENDQVKEVKYNAYKPSE